MPDVSVVVCTRDRPELLGRALASLLGQTLARAVFEIVVVDNGEGEGEAVARTAAVDSVLRESRAGLSRARNAGWHAATAPLVAFIDDDAEAEETWLERALDLASRHPRAFALGGPILPVYDHEPPEWFRDDYERRTWGETERTLRPGETLSGSNVFLTRRALETEGGFDERLGMAGRKLGVGEETELFGRLWRHAEAEAVYSPELVVRHVVSAAKTTVAYQLRRAAAAGEAWSVGEQLRGPARAWRVAADAAIAASLTARALVRLRRPLPQWAIEELGPAAGRVGSLRGALR